MEYWNATERRTDGHRDIQTDIIAISISRHVLTRDKKWERIWERERATEL